jgi:hypothetical protein
LNLASAFIDGTNLLAQSTARAAASNSASNLEQRSRSGLAALPDAALLRIRRTKNYGRRTRFLP